MPTQVMLVGDSITWGHNPDDGTRGIGGFRRHLWAQLGVSAYTSVGLFNDASEAVPSLLDATHNRHSGWPGAETGSPLSMNVGGWVTTYNPDVVVVMAGTNNWIDNAGTTAQQVADGVNSIVGNALAAKSTLKVIVVDCPPISPAGSTYGNITNAKVAAQNAVMDQQAQFRASQGQAVSRARFTGISFVAGTSNGAANSDYSTDGLHFNDPVDPYNAGTARGYAKMVEPIRAAIVAAASGTPPTPGTGTPGDWLVTVTSDGAQNTVTGDRYFLYDPTNLVDTTGSASPTMTYVVPGSTPAGTVVQLRQSAGQYPFNVRDGAWSDPPLSVTLAVADSSQPATPVPPTISAVTTTKVTVAFPARPSTVASYTLQRNTSGGTFANLQTGLIGSSYDDATVSAGVTYGYRIIALGVNGVPSDPSQPMFATPSAAPAAPTGVTATATAPRRAVVTWSAVAGATGYTVSRDGTVVRSGIAGTTQTLDNEPLGTHVYTVQSGTAPNLSVASTGAAAIVYGADGIPPTLNLASRTAGTATAAVVVTGRGSLTITDDQPWLSVSPTSISALSDTPATVTITADTTGLAAADKAAVITWTEGPVVSAQAPSNLSVPTITGTVRAGNTLTGVDGSWSNTPTSYTRTFYRNSGTAGAWVSVAAATTYALTGADVGYTIRFGVIATNASGSSVEAYSTATAAVQPALGAPTNTAAPTMTGTLQQAQPLTVTMGSWNDNGAAISGYTWKVQQSATSGGTYTDAVRLLRGMVTDAGTGGGYTTMTNSAPGTLGTDYQPEVAGSYTYLAGKGYNLAHVVFMLERVYPTPGAAENSTFIGYVDNQVANAAAAGMKVILQPFQKGAYRTSGGTIGIGDTTYTSAQWRDALVRLANRYKTNDTVVAISLDNEPALVYLPLSITGSELVTNGTFETNATGWTGASATVARSTAKAMTGTASLSVTSTATGTIGASATQITGLTAGDTYVLSYASATAATVRQTGAVVDWFTSGGAFISTSSLSFSNDATTFAARAGAQVTVPATGARASITLQVLGVTATGEVHYFDDVSFRKGTRPSNTQQWETLSQAAVTDIETAGWTKELIVPLGNFSALWAANTLHPGGPWITGTLATAGKIRYEGHHYFDFLAGSPGLYAATFTSEEANAVTNGFTAGTNPSALASWAVAGLNTFNTWLAGKPGYIGEVNVPGNGAELGLATTMAWYGASNTANDAFQDSLATHITNLGAKWARVTVNWSAIETADGTYNAGQLAHYDRGITKLRAAGCKIILAPYRTPSWARSGGTVATPPTTASKFGEFVTYITDRWTPEAVEIWNEPNLSTFWSGTAAQYVAIVQAGYTAAKATTTSPIVVAGALSQNDDTYLASLYTAGIKGYFDVLSVHPYAGWSAGAAFAPTFDSLAKDAYLGFRQIRARMLTNTDDKPIWFTECGYSSWYGTGGGPLASTQAAAESQQANYLTSMVSIARTYPYIGVICVYKDEYYPYTTAVASETNDWEGGLSIIHTDGTWKPAATAFQASVNNPDVANWKLVLETWFQRADALNLWVAGFSTGATSNTLLEIYARSPHGTFTNPVSVDNPQAATFEAHPGGSDVSGTSTGAAASFKASAAQVGKFLRSSVTATNAQGSTTAAGTPTSSAIGATGGSSPVFARYATAFDGVDDKIIAANGGSAIEPLTFGALLYSTSTTAATRFVLGTAAGANDPARHLFIYGSTGAYGWWDQAFGGEFTTAFPVNTWIWLVGSRNNNAASGSVAANQIRVAYCRLDTGSWSGEYLGSTSRPAGAASTGNVIIGAGYNNDVTYGFQGRMLAGFRASAYYTYAQMQATVSLASGTYHIDPSVLAAAPSAVSVWQLGGAATTDVTAAVQDKKGTAHESSRVGTTVYDAGSSVLPLRVA